MKNIKLDITKASCFLKEGAVKAFEPKVKDAQVAGSSSVPAHVEMMGFLGIGNNPMVGATVSIAVEIDLALNKK